MIRGMKGKGNIGEIKTANLFLANGFRAYYHAKDEKGTDIVVIGESYSKHVELQVKYTDRVYCKPEPHYSFAHKPNVCDPQHPDRENFYYVFWGEPVEFDGGTIGDKDKAKQETNRAIYIVPSSHIKSLCKLPQFDETDTLGVDNDSQILLGNKPSGSSLNKFRYTRMLQKLKTYLK